MERIDLSNVQEAGTSNRLPAGGYVCRYTNVTNNGEKKYLYMEFDIAEGEYKGYYKTLSESKGFWGGRVYKSYKPAALPMFKRMCNAVTKSNPGYSFDGDKNRDESTLVGKLVGIIFQEEEYEGNDGTVRTRLNAYAEMPVADIRSGKFKVPAKKCLPAPVPTEKTTDGGFIDVPSCEDEELPF